MIVRMIKYDLVVYHKDKNMFLDRLQELGLVDITTTGWEPNDEEHALLTSIEKHKIAISRLKELAKKEESIPAEPYTESEQAWEKYQEASANVDSLTAQIAVAGKEAEELKIWGEFDPAKLCELEKDGIVLRYFSTYTKEFNSLIGSWSTEYNVVPLQEQDGMTYFAVITRAGEEVAINARELKTPNVTYKDKERETVEIEKEKAHWNAILARAAASVKLIEQHGAREQEQLHLSQVVNSASDEAEGMLVIMEGWATRETLEKVDALLEEHTGVYYVKSNPTPDDDVPVKLKNKRLTSPFEIIGNFYSLPKYGTMDLTTFFGPFYMIFFGFCLGDSGYGLLFVIGSFLLRNMAKKKNSKVLKQAATLTLLCGSAAVVFGFFSGGFFGINLTEVAAFAGFKDKFFSTDLLFILALGMGVVQIFFALILQIINKTQQFGFKYSLGTLGWLMVLVGLMYIVLPNLYSMFPVVSIHYDVNMNIFYVLAGIGAVLMLFFHNPNKNPLKNFGVGLWNTYNDVTGFLGDFLSYIRLFALCLSGGTLALVFNDLAFGMTEGLPIILRQVLILVILLFGHGINLFMSALGAFVHPMRLTFVEFYKNAGFEATQREFTPLKKTTTKQNNTN